MSVKTKWRLNGGDMRAQVVICLVLFVPEVFLAAPDGCTNNRGMYECDYLTVNPPLSSSDFTDPPAQRIRIYNVNADLTSGYFESDFDNLDTISTFDPNFAATLEIKCQSGAGAVSVAKDFFSYMSYVYEVKIINCKLAIQDSAFSGFKVLNQLVIENGTTTFDAKAFDGVQVQKPTSAGHKIPVMSGSLVIRDSTTTGNILPAGLLISQTGLVSLTLEGMDLSSLDASLLTKNTALRFLSLGHNAFTELPTGLLDTQNSLAELHLYNTRLECTCEKLWLYKHLDTTRTKVFGDVICSSPTDWTEKKAAVFYYSECVEAPAVCGNGMILLGACVTWLELGLSIMCIVAFILSIVVLVLTIVTKKEAEEGAEGKRRGGRKPTQPRQSGAQALPKKSGPTKAKGAWN
ncbi:hypothetical protein DPMN_191101 [Dreissena polymorpha]|uniref:Uncharacterized protein n=1 Tax=Dreissena polymorpha TaxID=45954 RepID=A0A9D3XZG4_DREPO|nr:hypothetical protein DPMN_191101 [Dreissena polymorpha]